MSCPTVSSTYADTVLASWICLPALHGEGLPLMLVSAATFDSHGVFIWEGDSSTTEPSNAFLHKFSTIIVPEESPGS